MRAPSLSTVSAAFYDKHTIEHSNDGSRMFWEFEHEENYIKIWGLI